MEYAHAEINDKKIQRLLYFIVQQSFLCKKRRGNLAPSLFSHISKTLYSLCKVANSFFYVAMLDTIAYAVVDVTFKNNLSYLV